MTDQFDKLYRAAVARGRAATSKGVAVAVECDGSEIRVTLSSGNIISRRVADLPDLAGLKPEHIRRVEIHGPGTSLHFPDADADVDVIALRDDMDGKHPSPT